MGMNLEFQKFEGYHITEDILAEAAQLFSKHYGIWGKDAAELVGPFAKQGTTCNDSHNIR